MIPKIKIFGMLWFGFLMAASHSLPAQKTANQILFSLYQKSLKIKDYAVEVQIKVDLPFIKMLPVDAEVFFKQTDKFKVKSKRIAVLPKQGFTDFSKTIKDTNSYTAVLTGREIIGNSNTSIINIIPNSDTSDLILGKLWIDTEKNIVLKSLLTTKSNGTIAVEYTYQSQLNYGLPDGMVFTIDVKKFKIPKGVATDINNSNSPEDKTKDPKKGKIFISLKNYKINQGLTDDIFKE